MIIDLVANRVPPAIRAALFDRRGRRGRVALLHEVDHPDGYVRAWTGTGRLSFEGESWLGMGDLVSLDGLGGSRKTEVRVVTATLAGVKQSQLQFVTTKVRGRVARVSLAALRADQRGVAGDILPLCVGLCDTQDQKIDANGAASIVVTINLPIAILDRAPNLAWTPEWLKATYGSDITGLDDLPGVAARIESWTPAT